MSDLPGTAQLGRKRTHAGTTAPVPVTSSASDRIGDRSEGRHATAQEDPLRGEPLARRPTRWRLLVAVAMASRRASLAILFVAKGSPRCRTRRTAPWSPCVERSIWRPRGRADRPRLGPRRDLDSASWPKWISPWIRVPWRSLAPEGGEPGEPTSAASHSGPRVESTSDAQCSRTAHARLEA
jgi:hypothetical protein